MCHKSVKVWIQLIKSSYWVVPQCTRSQKSLAFLLLASSAFLVCSCSSLVTDSANLAANVICFKHSFVATSWASLVVTIFTTLAGISPSGGNSTVLQYRFAWLVATSWQKVAGSNKGGGGALFNRWICAASVMAKRRRLLVNNIDRFIIDGVFWCMIVLIQQFRNSFFLSMGTFVWLSVVSTKLLKDQWVVLLGRSWIEDDDSLTPMNQHVSYLVLIIALHAPQTTYKWNSRTYESVHSHFSSNRW